MVGQAEGPPRFLQGELLPRKESLIMWGRLGRGRPGRGCHSSRVKGSLDRNQE